MMSLREERESKNLKFVGARDEDGDCTIQVYDMDTSSGWALNPRRDLHNHSPTGFNWGYGGSGPAQAALAILAMYLRDTARHEAVRLALGIAAVDDGLDDPENDVGDNLAVRFHQRFKARVIASLPSDGWEMTSDDIERLVAERFTPEARC